MTSARRSLYLASASPRRRALLAQIGVPCEVVKIDIDEAVCGDERPLDYVARLAAAKALAGVAQASSLGLPSRPVLAADTAVAIGDEILGKPRDCEHAVRMLELLSGRTHEVLTAVTLATGGDIQSRVSRSAVTFRVISAAEARDYWHTGEPHDKAGGYAIQGRGAIFVVALSGSYSGVMGLPLYETAQMLEAAGVPLWLDAAASPR